MRVERGFALALLFVTMTVGAASSRSAGPVGVERLLAADTPQGTTLFLTDGASPAIFSVEKLSGLTPQKIPLSSLTPFLFDRALRKPSGMALRGRALIVCDPGVPAVFEIDLDSRVLRRLPQFDGVEYPSDVAVSPSGEVAVADKRAHRVVWLSSSGEPRQVPERLELEPARLLFVGSDLQGLD